jgi:hypothetical protein
MAIRKRGWSIATGGDISIWYMSGTTISSGAGLGTVPTTWTMQGTNAD